MKSVLKNVAIIIILAITVMGCKNGNSSSEYQKIDPSTGKVSTQPSSNAKMNTNLPLSSELHTVVVNELLRTTKYLYLNVTENGEDFWIATRHLNVNVGETYHYKGGLLKTNYESKEHNRIFEKIYLVSNSLINANHGGNNNRINSVSSSSAPNSDANPTETEPTEIKPTSPLNIERMEGSMKISDLVANYKDYIGQMVQITGVCVKLNANIIGRNWIHLKDGTKDDYDLVITTNSMIKEGQIITVKAVVSVNKDFGAGYNYELILENGSIVK